MNCRACSDVLDAKGIKHVMSGDKLLVPADRKLEAFRCLMYANALPRTQGRVRRGLEEASIRSCPRA